jgi:hypothetical protein
MGVIVQYKKTHVRIVGSGNAWKRAKGKAVAHNSDNRLSVLLAGVAVSTLAMAAAGSPVAAQSAGPDQDPTVVDEIVVIGSPIVGSQAAAIRRQRSADNIVNVIAADTVGQFPDQNAAAALSRLRDLVQAMGAKVDTMDPAHHDLVLAVVSHTPHLIAYTMVGVADHLAQVSNSEVIQYSATGFRDFTRIAASDPTMWRDVFLTNKDAVLDILGRFAEELFVLQLAIRMGDWKVVLMEQRATRLQCWFEPFVRLRAPKVFNLRRDPFERADENSNTYWDWIISHAYIVYMMQEVVPQQIKNFKLFQPRQKPASFNLDAVMRQLEDAGGGANH